MNTLIATVQRSINNKKNLLAACGDRLAESKLEYESTLRDYEGLKRELEELEAQLQAIKSTFLADETAQTNQG